MLKDGLVLQLRLAVIRDQRSRDNKSRLYTYICIMYIFYSSSLEQPNILYHITLCKKIIVINKACVRNIYF